MKKIQTQTKSGLVMAALIVCLGALLVTGCKKEDPIKSTPSTVVTSAICVIVPIEGNSCNGIVTFENTPAGVRIVADIGGLTANQKHGFHIHQFGDVSGLDGKSAGGHYDPEDTKNHGQPGDATGHAGDLGNLEADGDGKAHYDATIKGISVADAGKAKPFRAHSSKLKRAALFSGLMPVNSYVRVSQGIGAG